MTFHRRLPPALALCMAVGLATGCGASGALPVADLERVVADTVEAQILVRPEVDCGSGRVDATDGSVIDCMLKDPASGQEFTSSIRISKPGGGDRFTVLLTTSSTPINQETGSK